MTHFIGAVVVPSDVEFITHTTPTKYPDLYGKNAKEWHTGTALNEYLNKALAKFDENVQVEIWRSPEYLIEQSRARIKQFEDTTYAEYLKDPAAYEAKFGGSNPSHIEYLKIGFPEKLEWTDEQHYAEAKTYYEDEDIREDGYCRDTYNPDSKWDWWTVGGRWEETYRQRQGEQVSALVESITKSLVDMRDPEAIAELEAAKAKVQDVRDRLGMNPKQATFDEFDKAREEQYKCRAQMPWWFPYNIVLPTTKESEDTFDFDGTPESLPDYVWMTKGRMGWWGMHDDEFTDEQWAEQMKTTLENLPQDFRVVFIDFHI